MPHSGSPTTSVILPCVVLLLATLNLVLRFVIRPSEKARGIYINVTHLVFAAYLLLNDGSFWVILLVVLLYPDLRRSISSLTDSNQLITDAVLLYVLGTKFMLDSMGLSKLYMRPSVLLAATLIVVVMLIWWTLADSKRLTQEEASLQLSTSSVNKAK